MTTQSRATAAPVTPAVHALALPLGREAALAALARAAEEWGAEFTREGAGGRLALPVVSGLRRGWVRGRVTAAVAGEGTRLELVVEEAHYRLHTASVVVLLLAFVGALVTLLWPIFPRLLPLAPFGLTLAVAAWLLVVSRLTTAGPEEFLARVAAEGGVGGDAAPE